MLENEIEKHLKKEIEKIKGKAYKFSSPQNNGVPDRIVLYKSSCYFIELKREGEVLRPLQRVVKKRFSKLGFKVYVIDSVKKVDCFIQGIKEGGDQFHD